MPLKKEVIITLRVDTSRLKAEMDDAISALARLKYLPLLSARQMQAVLFLSFIILVMVLS